jgi:uncharacterized SAM-binding protein YcdF (DUF218 family)
MRLFRFLFLVALTLSLACVAGFLALCLTINYYGHRDLAQPADAIVVLGAKVLPNRQPGPDLRARTQHAVDLYRADMAPHLICSGGVKDDPSSAAAVCRAMALDLGVPAETVFVADGSANTEEDARQVSALMAHQGWHTAIAVSHPLHLYRVKLFFEKEGLVVYTSPTTTNVDSIDLWLRGYYTIREATGILWPYLEKAGFSEEWTSALEEWVYSGP